MEEIGCPFCKNIIGKVFWEENGYLGKKCDDCEVIFISPRPDEKEMEKLYATGEAGGDNAKKHQRYSFYKDIMARHTLKILKSLKQTGDILELGSGGGQFLKMAKKYGFTPFGEEINRDQADFISKNFLIQMESKPAEDDSIFGERKFDIIYHKDLLSHLRDPIKAFKVFYEKLKPGGILVFETGNNAGLSMFWLKFLGRMSYPEHLYFFFEKSVRQLLDISGFKTVKRYSYSIVLARLAAKLLGAPKNASGNKIFNEKTTLGKKLESYFMFFLTYRIGKFLPRSWPSTIIYVAVKK